MAKTREQKQALIENLVSQLSTMKGGVLLNYQGLTVKDMEDLRKKLRERESKLTVIRRTLLARAFTERGITLDLETLDGSLAIAVSSADEVSPASVIHGFRKDHEQVNLLSGFLVDGDQVALLNQSQVQQLAVIPPRPELLAKVVGSIKSPINGFVNVLAGNMRSLVTVLSAIKDQKSA